MGSTIYMVDNGEEYSSYRVLALFTDRALADQFAATAKGRQVSLWEADVPRERWHNMTATIEAERKCGKWVVYERRVSHHDWYLEDEPCCFWLGHPRGWRGPDHKTGQYTRAHAEGYGQSEEQALKRAVDALWKMIGEIEVGDDGREHWAGHDA